ncbi:MAG: hypothetical protein QGG71_01735 [Pirellulaceae bacterium]|jgi:hypothetical protein|nr:hypothetical protein [Pirellulaceae bacterium]
MMSSIAFPRHLCVNLDEATSLAALQRRPHFAHSAPERLKNNIMLETRDLSLERQDMVDLQRAHSVIQRRWQQGQPSVRRYQALCQRSNSERPLFEENSAIRIYLNPLRAWCRLQTSLFLDDDVPPPATILLFAVGDLFASRVFELEGQTLVNELADYQPCTLDQWSKLSALADRDQLVSLCQDLSDSGLICFS